ncbi:MAG TPA: hypothetical protein VFE53_09235 [Mucilaginibacter sp.]|jgi:hypothetical protein|nr:hypothetical protein [Mucilaginibacter sp.]
MLRWIVLQSILLIFFGGVFLAYGQQACRFNLAELLRENKVEPTRANQQMQPDGGNAISEVGILWLKGVTFKDGTIDIDLKGWDVQNMSFIGVAFHGRDTTTYDAVYFRPFNFYSPDTSRRKHAVEYISHPDYPWERLRAEHPLIYEHPVYPVPDPDKWFHATIVVKQDSVSVYVNHFKTASLIVKKPDRLGDGKIGLWTDPDALSGSFANLTITNFSN